MKTTTRTRTIPTAPYPISEKRTECTERDIERISLGGINIVFEDEMIEKDSRQEMSVPSGTVDLWYPLGTFPAIAERACDFYRTRVSFFDSKTGKKRKFLVHG